MNREQLISEIKRKKTFLCVGLDSDIKKLPKKILETEDPIFEFNRQIIDATAKYCVAYKPNLAFYESEGTEGIKSLERTIKYIREHYPEQFIIADAKRGDIGNTSAMYARFFFEHLNCDAVTVAPYMGEDSVKPFLSYSNGWVIVLALTSNKGSEDFQQKLGLDGEPLYKNVLKTSKTWSDENQMMYVVGATKAQLLKEIREIIPNHFLLVPGVGAQGGSLKEVANYGMNKDCGLLVNASRSIIFASQNEDFAQAAGEEAARLQNEMKHYLEEKGLIIKE